MLTRTRTIIALAMLSVIILPGCAEPSKTPPSQAGVAPSVDTSPEPSPLVTEQATDTVLRGTGHMKNIDPKDSKEGYTFDIHWALVSPKTQDVMSLEATKLGSKNLELSFNSAFVLENTTPGDRTLWFYPSEGPYAVAVYPDGSEVCEYGGYPIDEGGCVLIANPPLENMLKFKDIQNSTSIVEGEQSEQEERLLTFRLMDVPEAKAQKAAVDLLGYTELQVATSMDSYGSQCSPELAKYNGYTGSYTPFGTPGSEACHSQ
jgi:hypothetical protein